MEAAQGSSALQSAAGWTHKAFLFYEAVFPTLNSSPCFPTRSPHYSGPWYSDSYWSPDFSCLQTTSSVWHYLISCILWAHWCDTLTHAHTYKSWISPLHMLLWGCFKLTVLLCWILWQLIRLLQNICQATSSKTLQNTPECLWWGHPTQSHVTVTVVT